MLEEKRQSQPEEYLRAFLIKAVKSDRKLPIIVFDNADQFPPNSQDAIFQLANAISATATVLNIVPITDRTVWRLSNTGALQSYAARSFYLPVPEAKKILSKRIEYIKKKLADSPDLAKQYFSSKGFRVKLENIDQFAAAVQRIFVDNDFVSGLIGRLANFDIRRMLVVAERIFMSPEIRIDEVLRGSFGVAPGRSEMLRIHRALIKGEYDRYSYKENSFVYNLFWTDPSWPSSPLLAFYILWTLRARMAKARADSVDSRHWNAGDLASFFEPTGVHPDQTVVVLQRLIDRSLVETLDPGATAISLTTRIAITECGVAHIDLVMTSEVYLEQMALATGLNQRSVFNQVRSEKNSASPQSFRNLRQIFAHYLIDLDGSRLKIPTAREYAGVEEARRLVRGLAAPGTQPNPPKTSGRSAPAESIGGTIRRRTP